MPAGMAAHAGYSGDLDGDGDLDQLVVLYSTGTQGAMEPRGLLLLVRDPNDHWRVAAKNDRAVLCARCGGAMGDPLAAVEAEAGGFVLRFEGGSRELWSATYRFRYDAAASTWLLAAAERKVLDRITGVSQHNRADATQFGRLPFTEFDAMDNVIAPLD